MDGAYESNQLKEIELEQCSILFFKQLNQNDYEDEGTVLSGLITFGRPEGTSMLSQASCPGEEEQNCAKGKGPAA